MWYNIIFTAVIFIAVIAGFSGYSFAKGNSGYTPDKIKLVDALEELQKIPTEKSSANNNSPAELLGAMCYKMAAPLQRIEYICPVCGERTLYDLNYNDVDNLYDYRALVKQITKIEVKLDESQFCKKCSKNITDPHFCLLVKYGKNKDFHKTCGINRDDIILLREFSEVQKELIVNGTKHPIMNYKARLEELLGVTLKDNGK
jgi:hypothetical protein